MNETLDLLSREQDRIMQQIKIEMKGLEPDDPFVGIDARSIDRVAQSIFNYFIVLIKEKK